MQKLGGPTSSHRLFVRSGAPVVGKGEWNRTTICGFGDRRVTITPRPLEQAAGIEPATKGIQSHIPSRDKALPTELRLHLLGLPLRLSRLMRA